MNPRQNLRQFSREIRLRTERGLVKGWRRLPVPIATRRRLVRRVAWRNQEVEVPLQRILLGGQHFMSAGEYAAGSDDLLWPSTPVADGPHVDLLRRAAQGELTDEEILESPYGKLARTCIRIGGHYFGAVDDAGVVQVAREFVAGRTIEEERDQRPAQSDPGEPVHLAAIRNSDCFQVVDGHHRLAERIVAGDEHVTARVRRVAVTTPLQDLLDKMSWIGGKRLLYQPVDAPELDLSWTTVRRCQDRLDAMDKQLADLGVTPSGSTHLDVASAYGWFVAEMSKLGFTSSGIERDPLARELGPAIYGIDPEQVVTGDAVDFLRAQTGTYDVVSCFSLLHHFALGRGSVDAVGLYRLLDRVTGRVLFIDTGQNHEAWFQNSLAEWDTEYIAEFLQRYGTFDRVIDLGPDQDAVAPYEDNYARHLFACVRD